MADGSSRTTLADLLAEARGRLDRLDATAAFAAQSEGALLIDTRSSDERARDGVIPGALHIPRSVLEWRLDPASPHRLPEVTGHDQTIILVCAEGYASSLAAATLQDLGLRNATDLAGGYAAWVAEGRPS